MFLSLPGARQLKPLLESLGEDTGKALPKLPGAQTSVTPYVVAAGNGSVTDASRIACVRWLSPGKNIFSGRSDKLVEERRYQLATYLTQLLQDFPRVLETPTIDSFFMLQARLASEIAILVREACARYLESSWWPSMSGCQGCFPEPCCVPSVVRVYRIADTDSRCHPCCGHHPRPYRRPPPPSRPWQLLVTVLIRTIPMTCWAPRARHDRYGTGRRDDTCALHCNRSEFDVGGDVVGSFDVQHVVQYVVVTLYDGVQPAARPMPLSEAELSHAEQASRDLNQLLIGVSENPLLIEQSTLSAIQHLYPVVTSAASRVEGADGRGWCCGRCYGCTVFLTACHCMCARGNSYDRIRARQL